VDVERGCIIFANAGHPSPLLVHGATCEVEPITARRKGGPALGLFEDVRFSTHEIPVAAGDLILAFTDGLFEAENANAEPFSIARLRESIRSRKGLLLDQLMQDVFSEIKSFAEGQLFSDDVCFVGMEITRLKSGVEAAIA
jgi:serine phosphatase RsbU (regulator of sigma subunit)